MPRKLLSWLFSKSSSDPSEVDDKKKGTGRRVGSSDDSDDEETSGRDSDLFYGTAKWAAPELCQEHFEPTSHSDVFAFGIIVWEVVTRKKPYEGKDVNISAASIRKLIRKAIRPGMMSV